MACLQRVQSARACRGNLQRGRHVLGVRQLREHVAALHKDAFTTGADENTLMGN